MDEKTDESKVIAPWTDDQVARLRERQDDYGLHPYTCAYHSERSLEPTNEGWRCSTVYPGGDPCQFTQNWAHAVDVAPKEGSR